MNFHPVPVRMNALKWLDSLDPFYIRPGLGRIEKVLAALGRPHRRYPSVLVGGTNGKGSVAALLSAVLAEADYRVGLYTSPHLVTPRERIAVAKGRAPSSASIISKADFAKTLNEVRRAATEEGVSLTYFEALTAAAFLHFARKRVDIAVVEVGMGGTWDATNVLEPIASVITNVELDHTERLGKTRAVIARDKAGIIRKGRALVAGKMKPSPLAVIRKIAAVKGARFIHAPAVFFGKAHAGAKSGLAGKFQEENAATALAVLLQLGRRFPWSEAALRRGFARVHHPARLEQILMRPITFMDAAHNAAGALALAGFLKERRERPRVIVASIAKDKNVSAMLAAWRGAAELFVATEVMNPRMLSADALAALARRVGILKVEQEASPLRVLRIARRLAGKKGLVCVAGSLFLAGEILKGFPRRRS